MGRARSQYRRAQLERLNAGQACRLMTICGVRESFVDASHAPMNLFREPVEGPRKITAARPRKIMVERPRKTAERQDETSVELRRRILVYRLRLR